MSDRKKTWDDVITEYIEAFRYCGIFYEEPGGNEPLLSRQESDDCYSLKDDTPESVHDRIERSKKVGRNLFFEECPIVKDKYDPDRIY